MLTVINKANKFTSAVSQPNPVIQTTNILNINVHRYNPHFPCYIPHNGLRR